MELNEQELLAEAKRLNEEKKYEETIELLSENTLKMYKKKELKRLKSVAYYHIGSRLDDLGKYTQAIDAYENALKLTPNDSDFYNNLGIVYKNLKKNDVALKNYNRAIELSPKDDKTYYNRAILYDSLNEYEKAIGDYKTFLELVSPDDAYFIKIAKDNLIEINKKIKDKGYKEITNIVERIKEILSFEDGTVTHYTSLTATKNLILKDSPFRLSEGAFLNDTAEGGELFDFLNFSMPAKKQHETIDKLFIQKPFIGSFVAEKMHNNLTLWRMYGKEEKEEAKGCAITIKIDEFIKKIQNSNTSTTATSKANDNEFKFYRVAYRKKKAEREFIIPLIETGTKIERDANEKKEIDLNNSLIELENKIEGYTRKLITDSELGVENIQSFKDLFELLNTIAFLFKSEEYQHEQELRLTIKGIGFDKNGYSYPPLREDELPKVYIELIDISTLISKITLGPKVEKADELAASFYYKLGLDDDSKFDENNPKPEILISHLPYK